VWFDPSRPLGAADPLGRVKPDSFGLVHPFFMGENLIGTLAVGKAARNVASVSGPNKLIFTASQTNVVGTFAEFLSIQIVNSRFQDELVRNRLVAHELAIAKNIQQLLLLKKLPELPGLTLAAHCESAHQVGGDFYDVIKIGSHAALLVIADVMGKGVPAALFAGILRTMLRAAPELAHQPAALLTRVNRLLFEELSGVDMFITAQLAYVDAAARRLVTASAGHCPLLWAADGPSPAQAVSPEGMPLGIREHTVFAEETLTLPARCRVLLYTDGMTEALDPDGGRFGQERLAAWLERASALGPAPALKSALALELEKFQAGAVLRDDQTFLIMVA
jgi:serine phosphatase RsbU (regulator of sigma subunit)